MSGADFAASLHFIIMKVTCDLLDLSLPQQTKNGGIDTDAVTPNTVTDSAETIRVEAVYLGSSHSTLRDIAMEIPQVDDVTMVEVEHYLANLPHRVVNYSDVPGFLSHGGGHVVGTSEGRVIHHPDLQLVQSLRLGEPSHLGDVIGPAVEHSEVKHYLSNMPHRIVNFDEASELQNSGEGQIQGSDPLPSATQSNAWSGRKFDMVSKGERRLIIYRAGLKCADGGLIVYCIICGCGPFYA